MSDAQIEIVLERLERVKRSGAGWTARCPAHEDREPSLSIGVGEEGRVLLNCHAGCSHEAIAAALGLQVSDLFTENGRTGGELGEPEAVYPYVDEKGELLFEVVRFPGKRFLQRRPDATEPGGYVWKLGRTRRVLYRLPAVLAAIEAGEPVYLFEGEKDVEAAERLGATATTCPGGAGKWKSTYAESLLGADVIVVPDLDDPGRRHALDIVRSLEGKAASVEVRGPMEGKDLCDHLAAGYDLEGLEPWGIDDLGEEGEEREEDEPPAWEPKSIVEVAAEPQRRPTKLSGTLYDQALTLLSGEPGVGKSMFLTAAVASEAIEGGTALYLDFEGTPGTLLERLEAAGLSDEQLRRVYYLRPTVQVDPEAIRAMVAELKPTLIAVDSYDAALAAFGLEPKNEDIRAFDALVMVPLRSTGATVVVADHVVKRREERGPYSIGGQAKLALADSHLGLSVIAPLHRGGRGKLKVKPHKDRHGWLPRASVFELNSHPETGALSWDVSVEQDAGEESDGFRPTVLMERASRYLEIQSEPVSQSQIERDVQGKGTAKRQALIALIDEGYVEATAGPRGARLLLSVKPFRESEE